jgi:hypothetical protein
MPGRAPSSTCARTRLRPRGWTSADAAGLPILPGLARYAEVRRGRIDHALRFTASRTRRAFIYPARHFASDLTDPDLPAMGQRLRLKRSFDISRFPRQSRVVLRALRRYGVILADKVRERPAAPRLGQRRPAFPPRRARQRLRGRGHVSFAPPLGGYLPRMWGLTTVVGAFALALIVMSFAFMGGAVIVAVPLALVAVGIAAFMDFGRRRKTAQSIHRHQHDDDVDFTERDRRTLVSE